MPPIEDRSQPSLALVAIDGFDRTGDHLIGSIAVGCRKSDGRRAKLWTEIAL